MNPRMRATVAQPKARRVSRPRVVACDQPLVGRLAMFHSGRFGREVMSDRFHCVVSIGL